MSYLLDTNAFVDHLRRGSASKVTPRLRAASPRSVYLCSVVLAELLYGALRVNLARRPTNLAAIKSIQSNYTSLPFDDRAALEYGQLRAHLTAIGLSIGPNDLMIASIALANGMTLVTHNTKEFSRVPGLTLEDWQI